MQDFLIKTSNKRYLVKSIFPFSSVTLWNTKQTRTQRTSVRILCNALFLLHHLSCFEMDIKLLNTYNFLMIFLSISNHKILTYLVFICIPCSLRKYSDIFEGLSMIEFSFSRIFVWRQFWCLKCDISVLRIIYSSNFVRFTKSSRLMLWWTWENLVYH